MNVHVLRERTVEPVGGGEPWAVVVPHNPLAPGWNPPGPGPRRWLAWSGWLDDSDPAWSPRGHAAFDAMRAAVRPRVVEQRAELCFRTHAAHVLSDVPSCAEFARGPRDDVFGLALDPAAMLTAAMLPDAREHLEGICRLARLPRVRALIAANAVGADDGARPVALHRGIVDPAWLASLVLASVSAPMPLILLDDELDAQVDLLRRAGARI